MTIDRRGFLRGGAAALLPLGLGARRQQGGTAPTQQGRAPGSVAGDTLANDFGQVAAVGPLDNDPVVIGIERRLHCTCGCTLDVYTCRTTDFSCTFSPAMHQDVVTQVKAGMTPDQILQAFVTKDGPGVLMAPPARGFSLVGYLAPGLAIAAALLVVFAWMMRRRDAAAVAVPAGAPMGPTAADRERLRRALDDVDS